MPEPDVRGKSLLDLLWEQLDQFVEELQVVADVNEDSTTLWEARGRAHATAVCVALVTNPYHPDVDSIKSDAMERWELRQGVSDYQEKLVQKIVRTRNERSTQEHLSEMEQRREERRARRLARRAARNS